ncbi:MAG: DUF3795 domain-containing protein [Blautia sp.]|nr:DUF3795 domain-containing protein [Blautia sp.]
MEHIRIADVRFSFIWGGAAALWIRLNGVPITPEMIKCQGCRADGVKTVFCDSLCAIRQCAMKKGVTTCGGCPKLDSCPTVGTIHSNNAEASFKMKIAKTIRFGIEKYIG